MIIYDDGSITINGSTIDTVMDLAGIIYGCKLSFSERHGEDVADKLITYAGKVAYIGEDEMTPETAKMFADMFCEIADSEGGTK